MEGLLIISGIGYIFYNSILAGLVFLPYVFFHIKIRRKAFLKKETEKLAISFKDGMQSVKASLQAGYSIENAFKEALTEIDQLYGRESGIYKGFRKIVGKLAVNVPVEEAFLEFADECKVEEISYFAEVLRYAKRSGGNLVEIISNTTEIIADKIEVKREIQVIMASKKMEQIIMSIVPILIILYMRISSFGTVEKLYGNTAGIVIMTVCLGVYVASIFIAEKISNISI